jgi:glycosyltransferase involved in cell wall biosynthesis
MAKGYGVDVVVSHLSKGLVDAGHAVAIGCIDSDGFYCDQKIYKIAGTQASVLALLNGLRPDVVIIHTVPFFEQLPVLKDRVRKLSWANSLKWVVWEHGDPFPELFPDQQKERELEKKIKQEKVYPEADALVVISEFIGRDIGFSGDTPSKTLIYNGADHAPDFGQKSLGVEISQAGPIRVGILSRIGKGEQFYKGTSRFHNVLEILKDRGVPVVGSFMGRGEEEYARELRESGYEVHLNASEEQKWQFLRKIDIFVSSSRWEGFNLPLVEAQAVGTLSMAFDCGAHSEVCEYVFQSEKEMADTIERFYGDRQSLYEASKRAYQFSRTKFRWSTFSTKAIELLAEFDDKNTTGLATQVFELSLRVKAILFFGRVEFFIKKYGVFGVFKKLFSRALKRFNL